MKKKIAAKKKVKKELAIKEVAPITAWQRVEAMITPDNVRKYLCPDADDMDLFRFGHFCKTKHLDPFNRQAYLIKYKKDEAAGIVTAVQTFFERADNCKAYDGISAGVVVRQGTRTTYREGAIVFPGETLIGGWAETSRKDRKKPSRAEVSLSEYEGKKWNGEITAMWKNKKATMIVKVGKVQSLRECFPAELGDMYIPDEMDFIQGELPTQSVELPSLPGPKEKVIDITPEKTPPPELTPEPKEEEKPPENAPNGAGDEKSITAFQCTQIAQLIGTLSVPADEKLDYVKMLQIQAGIADVKKTKDFTHPEAVAMIELLKKQITDSPAPKKEEPKKPAEVPCVDCGCEMKHHTKTLAYSRKMFKAEVCFKCGNIRKAAK